MDGLTSDQGSKLDALIAELEQLPTPELLIEAGRLRLPLPLDDAGRKRFRLAFSGGVAAQKLLSYIETLEEVDDHRGAIGQRISHLQREGNRLRAMQSLDAARLLLMANHLAGRQEVDFHFFAVCVGRIERLLPIAAKAAGYKIPIRDRELLASYRPLRDYYEHLEDRLPGGRKYPESEVEREQDGEWRIRVGLTLDDQERVVIDGVAVDVTPRGVATVRAVLRGNWEQLKPSALAMVRKHYENDLSGIPRPEEVNTERIVSTGGRVGRVSAL